MQERGCVTKTSNLKQLSKDYCDEMEQDYKPVSTVETFIFYYCWNLVHIYLIGLVCSREIILQFYSSNS